MFCRKCGKELSDNAKFCNRCGTPVIKDNKIESNLDNETPQQEVEVVYNIPVTELEESNNNETDNVEQTNVDDNKETEDIEQTDINDSNKTDNLEQDEVDNNKETEDLERNNLDDNKETDDSEKTDQEKLDELLLAEIHRQYDAAHPNEHNEETKKEVNGTNKTAHYYETYAPDIAANLEKSNIETTTKKQKEKKFVYDYSKRRFALTIFLSIFLVIFAFNTCTIFSVRNLITKSNIEKLFVNVDIGNFDVVLSNKSDSDISLGQQIMNLMGDEIVDKYDISETDMTDFLSDEEIEEAIGDIYYDHFTDVLESKNTYRVTATNFVDIFRNHKDKVKEKLDLSFDDEDYNIMQKKFHYGFLSEMPTSAFLYAKYPVSTVKTLVSSKMLWLNICLFAIFSVIIYAVNKFNLDYTITFVVFSMAFGIVFLLLTIIFGILHHGPNFSPLFIRTFLIILAIILIPIGIMFLKEKIHDFLSN